VSELSGNLWPLHLKPKPDELISSWIVRLAFAQGLEISDFCNTVWPRRGIWKHDIDRSADQSLLEVLAKRTATPYERVLQTVLTWYEGRLFEKHNPTGNTAWVLPLGVYSRTRKLYGLQCCPQCLAKDSTPYYRTVWRLGCFTVCIEHGCMLVDCCPQCQSPLFFHMCRESAENMVLCGKCQVDLRNFAADVVAVGKEQVARQQALLDIINAGWVDIPGHGPVYSHLYFSGLHLLVKVLKRGRPSYRTKGESRGLRQFLELELGYGSNLAPVPSVRFLEWLRVDERFRLIDLACWLLEDWPTRFVEICSRSNFWNAYLTHQDEIPYWFDRVVKGNLLVAEYSPTDREVESVIAYLKNHGMMVSGNKISALLDVHKIFKRREKRVFKF